MGSIRVRLLLVAAVVALAAVAATTVIAQRIATEDVRSAVERDLELEAEVAFLVESYAIETGTWDGLDEFVELVALDLDERIAVIDDFGRTIADSDPGLALPAQPIARVEPEPFLVEDVALDQAVAACELLANVQDVVTELDFDDCVEEVLDEAGLGEVGGALVYLGDDSRNDASLLGRRPGS